MRETAFSINLPLVLSLLSSWELLSTMINYYQANLIQSMILIEGTKVRLCVLWCLPLLEQLIRANTSNTRFNHQSGNQTLIKVQKLIFSFSPFVTIKLWHLPAARARERFVAKRENYRKEKKAQKDKQPQSIGIWSSDSPVCDRVVNIANAAARVEDETGEIESRPCHHLTGTRYLIEIIWVNAPDQIIWTW